MKPSKKSPRPIRPSRAEAIGALTTLLRYIGENSEREGLIGTPDRVLRAWEQDWGLGYDTIYVEKQIKSIINGKFTDGSENYSQMVSVQKIRFTSHCEHHMAQFSGTVDVAYIPAMHGPIIGLSKFVRVVELFSKRLQVQERMTQQIAEFIDKNCSPIGVGVVAKATHSCMCSRGVKQFETEAVTSALRGEMLTKPEVRDEFLRLVGR